MRIPDYEKGEPFDPVKLQAILNDIASDIKEIRGKWGELTLKLDKDSGVHGDDFAHGLEPARRKTFHSDLSSDEDALVLMEKGSTITAFLSKDLLVVDIKFPENIGRCLTPWKPDFYIISENEDGFPAGLQIRKIVYNGSKLSNYNDDLSIDSNGNHKNKSFRKRRIVASNDPYLKSVTEMEGNHDTWEISFNKQIESDLNIKLAISNDGFVNESILLGEVTVKAL